MRPLRLSTATLVTVGPLVATNGAAYSPTNITGTLYLNGSPSFFISTTGTNYADGTFAMVFPATNLASAGRATFVPTNSSSYVPRSDHWDVLPAGVYDLMFGTNAASFTNIANADVLTSSRQPSGAVSLTTTTLAQITGGSNIITVPITGNATNDGNTLVAIASTATAGTLVKLDRGFYNIGTQSCRWAAGVSVVGQGPECSIIQLLGSTNVGSPALSFLLNSNSYHADYGFSAPQRDGSYILPLGFKAGDTVPNNFYVKNVWCLDSDSDFIFIANAAHFPAQSYGTFENCKGTTLYDAVNITASSFPTAFWDMKYDWINCHFKVLGNSPAGIASFGATGTLSRGMNLSAGTHRLIGCTIQSADSYQTLGLSLSPAQNVRAELHNTDIRTTSIYSTNTGDIWVSGPSTQNTATGTYQATVVSHNSRWLTTGIDSPASNSGTLSLAVITSPSSIASLSIVPGAIDSNRASVNVITYSTGQDPGTYVLTNPANKVDGSKIDATISSRAASTQLPANFSALGISSGGTLTGTVSLSAGDESKLATLPQILDTAQTAARGLAASLGSIISTVAASPAPTTTQFSGTIAGGYTPGPFDVLVFTSGANAFEGRHFTAINTSGNNWQFTIGTDNAFLSAPSAADGFRIMPAATNGLAGLGVALQSESLLNGNVLPTFGTNVRQIALAGGNVIADLVPSPNTNAVNAIASGVWDTAASNHANTGSFGGVVGTGALLPQNASECNGTIVLYGSRGLIDLSGVIEAQVYATATNTTGQSFSGRWASYTPNYAGVVTVPLAVGQQYRLRRNSGTPVFFTATATGNVALPDVLGRVQS